MIVRRARRRSTPAASSPRAVAALRRALWVEGLEERRLLAADLAVSATETPDPFPMVPPNSAVVAGTNLTYHLSVVNNGDTAAQNVHLTDGVPARTTFFTICQTGGPAAAASTPVVGQRGTVDFAIPTLNPGE